VNGATLDAFINLVPGTYSATAQAWDNCGNVFKTPVTITDTGGPSGQFLYLTDSELDNIALYHIANGVLTIPGGGSEPPTFSVPANANSVAVDPPGNFAYVGLSDGRVSEFEINRANGYLFLKGTVSAPGTGVGPAYVTVDRAGAYLFVSEKGGDFVTSYSINRSSGLLTYVGSFTTGNGPVAVITDYTGRYVYTSNYNSNNISGYALNTSTGFLTQVPGSPYPVSGTQPVPLAATASVLYNLSNVSSLYGFNINGSSGSLTPTPGSPYDEPEADDTANSLQADPFHNLLFNTGVGFTFGTDQIQSNNIQPDGSLSGGYFTEGNIYSPSSLALDPSYQYLYVCEVDGYTGQPQVFSFKYAASNGAATALSGPLNRPAANPLELAVSQ
jgi:6-phosphogluconolactonase (cycloisomerase 2 family)